MSADVGTGAGVAMTVLCLRCMARGGLHSDRCEGCHDFSGFECGCYSTKALQGFSARAKLAYLLSELARIKDGEAEDAA